MSWLSKWFGQNKDALPKDLLVGVISPAEALRRMALGTLAEGFGRHDRASTAIKYITVAGTLATSIGRADLARKLEEIAVAIGSLPTP